MRKLLLFIICTLILTIPVFAQQIVFDQASDIGTDTTNFNNNLSSGEDTVQKALDSYDNTDFLLQSELLDEDAMTSNSATQPASQQSIKAYVDNQASSYQPADSDLTIYAGITPSSNVQSFLAAANYAAMRSLLSLIIGTNVQAYDADLSIYAGITPSANVQSLLAAANYAAMRALLDLEAGTDYYSISGANSNFLPFSGGTMTGALIADEQGIEFLESDDVVACVAGDYWIRADLSELTLKKCINGTESILDTTGGTPSTADINDVAVTQTELAELETIDATTISAAQWAILGGLAATLTATELNYVDGVTSSIQTQLNGKEGTLSNEAGLYAALSDVSQFYEPGDDVTADVTAASTTTAGKVELATSAEMDTATDAEKALGINEFNDSDWGARAPFIVILDNNTDTAVADGVGNFEWVPGDIFNGYNIVDIECGVYVAGTTNTTDIQIHNITSAADVLSTKCTIDSGETSSHTAATAAVINTAEDDITSADRYRFDIDAVSTTAARGLWIELTLRKP